MTEATLCNACGHPLSEDGLDGVCPSCVLKIIFEEDPAEPSTSSPRSKTGFLSIPGFEMGEELARGGMGIVYHAWQMQPRRAVALKMLLPHQLSSPGMRERFRTETRAIATLDHSGILPVYQVGEHNGLPFFAMKLARGGTLAQRKEEYANRWESIAELLARLADAVQFAHERGVLHRDLKPGNVLFDETGRAYVSDFGLAKLADEQSDLTRSVDLLGTPHYVAPEIAATSAKNATIGSDIYSLGAMLYELLSGAPPFQAPGVPALLKKITDEAPIPPSELQRRQSRERAKASGDSSIARDRKVSRVPRDLEVICLKCLEKNSARRYATARELAEDLRRWLARIPILARPAIPWERLCAWTRRNPAEASLILLLGLVLVGALLLQMASNRRLEHALAESLIKQAQLERASGRAGQRYETLAIASRAVNHLRAAGGGDATAHLMQLRSEVAAALALPDLRPLHRWPVHVAHFENEFDFSANLDRYIATSPDAGFSIYDAANHRPLRWIKGEAGNPPVELRLSADAAWAAVRYQNGQAALHSLTGIQPVRNWAGTPRAAAVLAFAPANDLFAISPSQPGQSRVIEILRPAVNRIEATLPGDRLATLAFDHRGEHLAVAGRDLAIWRIRDTNRLWSTPLTHESSSLAWSHDGRRLAVAMDRRLPLSTMAVRADPVLIFDAATGRNESLFWESSSRVERLAFHPDDAWLVAAAWDAILIGDLRSDSSRLRVEGAHRTLKVSPDGRRLAYAPSKGELAVSELMRPAALREWQGTSAAARDSYMLAISPDGRLALSATVGGLQLWDVEARRELAAHPLPAPATWVQALFDPGNRFVYYSAEAFGIRRIELVRSDASVRGGVQFGSESALGEVRGMMTFGYADDGRSIIVGEYRRKSINERLPPTVWLWPEGDPARARKLAGEFPLVGYRAIPGGEWAVSTDLVTPDVWIWNFKTGDRVRNLGIPLHVSSEPIPNGRWLVTRSRDEFAVWETGTWRRLSHWPARPDEKGGGSIKASPDSRLLASRSSNGRFVLRELPEGREVMALTPPRSMLIVSTAFTPDSGRLVGLLNNGRVMEWNLTAIRRELAALKLDWQNP